MNRLRAYITIESTSAILLFVGAALALWISNTGLYDEYVMLIHLPIGISIGDLTLAKPLIKWVNDGLMALFFLLLMLEIKFHLLEGDLVDKSHVKLATIASCGGVIIPVITYYCFTYSNPVFSRGWAIPIATDTAFVLGVLSFFKNKIPISARIFVVFLSIIDDVIAIIVLAVFYTPSLHFIPLLASSVLLVLLGALNLLNVRYLFPYILIGIGLWFGIVETGIHGTIAGVLLALFIPLRIQADDHSFHSPLKKLEQFLHPLVAFIILPIFAFLNAGISFKEINFNDLFSPVTLGIVGGLFIGKQIGITLSAFIFLKLIKAKLPYGLSWSTFCAIGMLCGIGFTLSLFIGLLSFEDPLLINHMKLGVILGSLVSALGGMILLTRTPHYPHVE